MLKVLWCIFRPKKNRREKAKVSPVLNRLVKVRKVKARAKEKVAGKERNETTILIIWKKN